MAQLQGEAREVVHLRGQLADKESEVAGLRAHLEEALREELADSDPGPPPGCPEAGSRPGG